MKNIILIIGSLSTLILAILWYLQIVSEPIVSVGTGVLTFIGYLLIPSEKENNKSVIKQEHKGKGDNIIGDKTTNNVKHNSIEIKDSSNTTVQLANSVVNNNYTIVEQEKKREKGNSKISNFSAVEIKDTVESSPVFQKEEVAKNYQGIRIKWKVTLNSIHIESESMVSLMTRFEGGYPWVNFEVDLNDYPYLKVAKEGKLLTITGLISSYRSNSFYIDLENMEEA